MKKINKRKQKILLRELNMLLELSSRNSYKVYRETVHYIVNDMIKQISEK